MTRPTAGRWQGVETPQGHEISAASVEVVLPQLDPRLAAAVAPCPDWPDLN